MGRKKRMKKWKLNAQKEKRMKFIFVRDSKINMIDTTYIAIDIMSENFSTTHRKSLLHHPEKLPTVKLKL